MIFQQQSENDARQYLLSRGNLKLAPHFHLSEMKSKDGADLVLVHPLLIALLEVIRTHFKAPVIINSGFRSDAHNRSVGGARNSLHLKGMAADIRVKDVEPRVVADYADEMEVGGVGRYSSWTHVDIFGKNRRWTG